ncbi:MAG: Capsule synthesis protein, CapA [Candidatus Azambacteria bacterium GW2011_GWC2_45_7b]|uniref:Capsule synthesis protein, CapA n=3 Tax=Parcubacteria group TaxID=1794811 RepID=A0A837IQW6_9BACT|nr:MAG: Capsule synthesis protein, CapA [Parcubacteria group bacterium GW2011_GWC1_44_10]KKT60046.1 MAG: Capsule synthesis protein, CapA [Candidatus Giovannonibacteria bacterium GW2011_GWA1_44_25]KKU12896.1 MAG: Capsule synthesis protein, CapA [Candidatus Azambacteria bacterium GW2011_GWC2_45_7b]KKU30164.1 MAG: Capsule synthesis protein, CapA [Candidatus Giovannonibacteria bacterium GW2011_GWB1_46_20]
MVDRSTTAQISTRIIKTMNFTLDRTGLVFTLKALLAASLSVYFVWFGSNIVFGHAYPQNDQRMESARENLSQIQTDRFYRKQNLASALDSLEKERALLAFVGDIMLDRGVKESILKNGGGDFLFSFEKIQETLKQYNVLFGNLEGPISDKGQNQGSSYSFRMDPKTTSALAFAGFNILSLANNHIGDWGEEAAKDTTARLESAGIIGVGMDYSPKILNLRGTKIAFLALSDIKGMVNLPFLYDKSEAEMAVRSAKEMSNLVIISMHFGEEYHKEPSVRQKEIAHGLIDAGADLVIGSHPHVVQPVEQYKNSYIAYSLGNFVFDQDFSEDTMRGLLFEVELENGQIIKIAPKTVIINENFQPTVP